MSLRRLSELAAQPVQAVNDIAQLDYRTEQSLVGILDAGSKERGSA